MYFPRVRFLNVILKCASYITSTIIIIIIIIIIYFVNDVVPSKSPRRLSYLITVKWLLFFLTVTSMFQTKPPLSGTYLHNSAIYLTNPET